MKSVLSLIAGLALMSANAWAGGVGINLKMKKNGVLRFAVVGDFREANGACLAKTFSIGVYDTVTGESNWYVSDNGRGKSEWNVNSNKCNTNQEISHELLQYGKVIEVRAFDEYGRTLDRYFANIPCEEKMTITQDGYDIAMGTATITSALVCGNETSEAVVVKDATEEKVVVATPPPPPTLERCSVSANVNKFDRSLIEVKASCNIPGRPYLRMTINGREALSSYVDVSDVPSIVATVAGRNKFHALEYQVSLTTSSNMTLGYRTDTILSDPSFNHPVRATFVSPPSQFAQVENDWLSQGRSYQATISLVANDADLKDLRQEIYMELVNARTGQVVAARHATSGETVRFTVTGRFEDYAFGESAWVTTADLQPGVNKFFVRVYDAFQRANSILLKDVTVIVE